MTTTTTASAVAATCYGLTDYLDRLNGLTAPGSGKTDESSARSKPASKPQLNLTIHDTIQHIKAELDAIARKARIELRILDGHGWAQPFPSAPLNHIPIYARVLEKRNHLALTELNSGLNDLHAKAERALGITQPPTLLNQPCPECDGPVYRHPTDMRAWCDNKTWHSTNGSTGEWDGHQWLLAVGL